MSEHLAVNMQKITKQFPLVKANDAVDFQVRWGEVHALIGENGAGKSTLMKILYGYQQPDSGTIAIDGTQVRWETSADAIAKGIGMVYQHFMLLEPLTVTENLILGAEPQSAGFIDYQRAHRRSSQLIKEFGFDLNPNSKIENLPLGLQQQVEILKTLYRDARIMIMDEPTAVLTPQETRALFAFIRDYAAKGNAVIFISHKLDEVMEICDRMSVMRDGKMIGTVNREDTSQRDLANMMVGREVSLQVEKAPLQAGEVKLSVRELELADPVKSKPLLNRISFDIRAGEILGVAGIDGNGQSELVECIAGLRFADRGEVILAGQDVSNDTPRERREAGLSHIPEDRNERGMVGEYSAALNSVLGDQYHAPYSNILGLLNDAVIEQHATDLIEPYDVRPRSTRALGQAYSGGNAQKLIVAREIERNPTVLIASQPTRGVDIGAIEFIHQQIVAAAREKGLAVLLISADLNEVMSLSDRIIVLYEGTIMGELSQEEATTEALGLMMAGSELAAHAL